MDTIFGDLSTDDIVLDSTGDIAIATDGYALAQDAASEIQTFLGECYYNSKIGIPYFQNIVNGMPSLAYLKLQFTSAALRVPGVVASKCFITSVTGRVVHGQVQITDIKGKLSAASF